jgi:hypothetical protein
LPASSSREEAAHSLTPQGRDLFERAGDRNFSVNTVLVVLSVNSDTQNSDNNQQGASMSSKWNKALAMTALAGITTVGTTLLAQDQNPPPPPATTQPARRERHERHPAIRRAIKELEEAKLYLQHAAHDFGGHRVAAIKECDEAIKQLREALKYDKD